MDNTQTTSHASDLPDWWQREKQRRQLIFLILLGALLLLIGYYYWVSNRGVTGSVPGIPFDTTNTIAFVRQDKAGNTDLYAIRADGTGLKRLTATDDKSNKGAPAWTADGKSLLYVSNLKDARTWQVYVLGSDDPKQLTYGTGNKSAPVASPNGKQAAFIAQGAIKTVNLNGTDVYQVMPPPAAGNSDQETSAKGSMDAASSIRGPFLSAVLSTDGSGIAGIKDVNLEENLAGTSDMILSDQAAFAIPPGGEHSLILASGHEVSAQWEPKGGRIACAFSEAEINVQGKKETLSGIYLISFKSPTAYDRQPLLMARAHTLEPKNLAWSPDGSKIAFECWRRKSEDERELLGIAVIPTDKPIPIRSPNEVDAFLHSTLVHFMIPASADGRPTRPLWSADGSRLLYQVIRKDGGSDLWAINGDGTDPINLTKGEGDNTQAAWSPMRAH